MEEWSEIPEFPNHLISTYGRVFALNSGQILKPRPSGWGYLQVVLYKNARHHSVTIHKIMGEVFLDRFPGAIEVNHKNGDKSDNHISNLEWVTKGGNNLHAVRTGLRTPRRTAVRIIETGEEFRSIRECARYLGMYPTTISAQLNGRLPHYKGLHFEYI